MEGVTLSDDELIASSCELAAELERRSRSLAGPGARRRQRRFRRLLASPSGAKLVFAIADRVLRPVDARTAAAELAMIATGPLEGFSATDRALLRAAGWAGRLAPFPVVKLVTARLRRETRGLIYPAEPRSLGRHLSKLRGRGNLNLLGEAVLGWDEATRRARAVEALLRRDDVACVSVKVSSVSSGLSLVDFDGSVERVCAPLRQLFQAAASCQPPKLVNLDMEEHGDLDLTLEAFFRTLAGEEGAGHTAGIALQAYLPGSHEALERVLSFAAERHRAGAPPVRVRLVKGANLAMEQGDAELRCWPQAPYLTKAETDASYKAMLERLLEAARSGTVEVGVASHNLFDVGFLPRASRGPGREGGDRDAGRDGGRASRRDRRADRGSAPVRAGGRQEGLSQRAGIPFPEAGREHEPGRLPPLLARPGAGRHRLGGTGLPFRDRRTCSP